GLLPPGLQQIEEAGRSFPQQRIRIGARIPKDLRRRFVDEADSILQIHHQDTLAQMLDDVLRQLRHVREIDFLATDQGLALSQTACHGQERQRYPEQHCAEYPCSHVVGIRRELEQTDEYL